MSDDSLIQAMPDVVAFVRPDGLVTHHLGGRQVPFVRGSGSLAGRQLEEVFDAEVAALISRLVRRAIASRGSCEAEFAVESATYEAKLSAQGPQRALCVIRQLAAASASEKAQKPEAAGEGDGGERRGFVRRLRASLADATLRERPLALCLIFLDGLSDIGKLIDWSIAERILSAALRGLPPCNSTPGVQWFIGRLGEGLLGVVIDGGADREQVRAIASSLCGAMAQPVCLEDASFHLSPCAGIAVLGQDATDPAALLEHARAAMLESRRTGAGAIHFYSDTLRMLPVARLDIQRELRNALAERQIGLHYLARHDLASGRMTAVHAYMRWDHPLRGTVPPAEFLPIADATGLAPAVSRAALARLAADLAALRERFGAEVPISFGALRQHCSSGTLARDLEQLLPAGERTRGRIELRIAERALASLARSDHTLREIAATGVVIVIDEFGRGFSSIAELPRLPLKALQIDRALVLAAARDGAALGSCKAAAALAAALDIVPIAAGIDDEPARARMRAIGFSEGFGDHYADSAMPADSSQVPLAACR